MRKPEPVEIIAAATPVFIAQAVVGVVLILGASIIINGHSLWAIVIGWAQ